MTGRQTLYKSLVQEITWLKDSRCSKEASDAHRLYLSDLKGSFQMLQRQCKMLNQAKLLNDEHRELSKRLVDSKVQNLKLRRDVRESEQQTKKSNLKLLRGTLERVSGQVQQLQLKLVSLQSNSKQLRAKLQARQEQLSAINQQQQLKQQGLYVSQKKLVSSSNKIKILRNFIDSAKRADLQTCQQENSRLQKQINKVTGFKQELGRASCGLEKSIENLRSDHAYSHEYLGKLLRTVRLQIAILDKKREA